MRLAAPQSRQRIRAPGPEGRISIRQARNQQCRYIECEEAGDAIVCGAPTIGRNSSWCAFHRRIVFAQS